MRRVEAGELPGVERKRPDTPWEAKGRSSKDAKQRREMNQSVYLKVVWKKRLKKKKALISRRTILNTSFLKPDFFFLGSIPSLEPNTGLELMTLRSRPELRS